MAFPSPPGAPGTRHTQGGATWEWDGTKWLARGGAGMVPAVSVPITSISYLGQTLTASDVQAALQGIFQRMT